MGEVRLFIARACAIVLIALDPATSAALTIEESVTLLRSTDPVVRQAARESLIRDGAPAVKPLLAAMRNERMRLANTAVIAQMGPKAVPALLALADDAEVAVRAGSVLAQIAGPDDSDHAPALLGCVRSKPQLNHYCGQALVLAMSPKAGGKHAPLLMQALSDSDETVRIYAAAALGQIGPRAGDAAAKLGEALGDKDAAVRRAAAGALGKLGRKAKPALPALQNAATNDADETVRREAQEALRQLNG